MEGPGLTLIADGRRQAVGGYLGSRWVVIRSRGGVLLSRDRLKHHKTHDGIDAGWCCTVYSRKPAGQMS